MLFAIMPWTVIFHDSFDSEFSKMSLEVQSALAAKALMLEHYGPALGRPHVDTLKASRHANMKELRFDADDGVWRVAFAFDHDRRAVLLLAGDKSGVSEKRFYKSLIATADARFDAHQTKLRSTK